MENKPKTPEPIIDQDEAVKLWKEVITHGVHELVEMLNKYRMDPADALHFIGHLYYKNIKGIPADICRRLLSAKLAHDAVESCNEHNERKLTQEKVQKIMEDAAKKAALETGLQVELLQTDGATYNRLFKKGGDNQ